MRSIKQSIQEALVVETDLPSNIKVPPIFIINAIVTETADYLIEYIEDEGVENGQELAEQIFDICRWWQADTCANEDAATWESEVAYDFMGSFADASAVKRAVRNCEQTMRDEYGEIELECFPESNDSIYSKTKEFVTYSNEDSFGYMAIPKNAKKEDVEFLKSMIDAR